MARALGAAHAPVPLIADDTVVLLRCDEEANEDPMVDAVGGPSGSTINGGGDVAPGLFWPSDAAGLYGARDFDGTQQQEFFLDSGQQAAFRGDQLTLELWFEIDSVTGTQRFVSVSGDRDSDDAAENALLAVGVVGDELNVFWETGSGTDVSNTTSAAGLQTGRAYKLGVVRKPSSNRNPAKCDLEVHIWDKRTGARYFELFTNVLLPTGGSNAVLVVAGEYDGSTGANQLDGRLDDIRVVSYAASMEAMRNTFFRAVRPWYPEHLVGLSSVAMTQVPIAVTKFLRVRVEQPNFDEGPDLEWAAAVSYADATGQADETFALAPATNGSAFSVSSGTLPPGLALDAGTGVISGTPTTPGVYSDLVVEASGPGGAATSAPFSISIEGQSSIEVSYPAGSATFGVAFSLAPTTNGTSFVLASGALPAGLSLHASTGKIGGTPTALGVYEVVVEATNSFGTVSSAPFSITVTLASLVAYWSMDTADVDGAVVSDSVGGLDGTIVGGAIVAGKVNQALQGTDFHLALGNVLNEYITPADAAFSVAMWVRCASTTTRRFLFGKASFADAQRQVWLDVFEGKVRGAFFFKLTSGPSQFRSVRTGAAAIQDNTWHHVVVAYNGAIDSGDGTDRVKVYVDGALVAVELWESIGVLADSIPIGAAHAAIGRLLASDGDVEGGNGAAETAFDEVAFFDDVLTSTQAAALAAAGIAGRSLA